MALPGDFEFAVRYAKGDENVCILDRKSLVSEDGSYGV